jgi:hypothetical protein
LPCRLLGTVENNPILHVTHNTRTLMDIALPKLLSAWKDRKIEGVQA